MNQPKPRVLVSFIGKGQSGGSSSGYRTTQYTFPDGWQSYELSVFGIALLTYYEQHLRQPVDRWLVLGSPQSNWDALLEAVPEDQWDSALNQVYEKIRDAVKAEEQSPCATGIGQLTQPLLDAWGDALSERLRPMVVKCQLVGWCEAPTSQLQMWRVLSQEVPEGSELVLDTTHSFRHQPMLLAPMVVLLGMLKNLSGVELYYGALDMDKRVLKLYQSQGQSLQLPPSLRFPPLREGNRVGRVGSVPPACRGNLKEGVIGHTRFCELWLRDWY
jgi:cell division protein DivIC